MLKNSMPELPSQLTPAFLFQTLFRNSPGLSDILDRSLVQRVEAS